ncbi:MAG: hypothetical protein IRY95_05140, partial [Clostridia bacterium]|nr:hypothetical protein [Clostridia bacterium]
AGAAGQDGGRGTRTAGLDLGRDAFLQLLVTQLRHQNPLEPMDNREFVAELAQFSALEAMEGLRDDGQAVLRLLSETLPALRQDLAAIRDALAELSGRGQGASTATEGAGSA